MKRAKPPFRADHVGSLLRPNALKEARAEAARGALPTQALEKLEDDAIRDAIRRQEEIGLRAATDGELRRHSWHRDFIEGLGGMADDPDNDPDLDQRKVGQMIVGKLSFPADHPFLRHFKFLRDNSKVTAKMTLPSPSVVAPVGKSRWGIVKNNAYRDLGDVADAFVAVYRDAISAFYAAGCRYLQIDEVRLVMMADPVHRKPLIDAGDDPDETIKIYADMLRRITKDKPADMTLTMHNCKGNFKSQWLGEGSYDPVADALFSTGFDGYFMEYDSDRTGGFEPLAKAPKNAVVVLGIMTSKSGKLESKDDLKRRIDAAAKYIDLDRLAISPQCGFASVMDGNILAEEEQWRKLALCVEVAEEVWGGV
jgi:5-methyltetrahydropteroyltriglutamate--homocysteine methyltransferase